MQPLRVSTPTMAFIWLRFTTRSALAAAPDSIATLRIAVISMSRGGDVSLPASGESSMFAGMTAVAEIESAIERLTPAELKELTAWLEEHQQMVNASAEIFTMYEQEEGGQ